MPNSETRPTVSIVTIFQNAEEFLAEAIESVRCQSFADWQLILVDDGSSDDSAAIARCALGSLPDRIVCCAHEGGVNRGMSASRNLGASHARGRYITFLDADDVWPREKLAEQVAILERETEAAMVYGRAKAWFSWNADDPRADHFWDLGVTPNQLVEPPRLFELLMKNKAQSPMSGNAMIRCAVFDEVGGFDDTFRGLYEDAVFFAKINLAYPAYVSDRTWLFYRQHANSCTAREEAQDYEASRLVFLNWLGDYLESKAGSVIPGARRAFEQELWHCRHPKLDKCLRGWPSYLMARVL